MEGLLTARRTKEGQKDAFRRKWRCGKPPRGMLAAYLLKDEEDQGPRKTLSVSYWKRPGQLRAYRSSGAATQREKQLQDAIEKARWQRPFAAFGAAGTRTGGRKRPLLLALLLVTAAAGVVYVMKKRRRQGPVDEATGQHPAPTPSETPSVQPAAATIAASRSASERVTPSAGVPTP